MEQGIPQKRINKKKKSFFGIEIKDFDFIWIFFLHQFSDWDFVMNWFFQKIVLFQSWKIENGKIWTSFHSKIVPKMLLVFIPSRILYTSNQHCLN